MNKEQRYNLCLFMFSLLCILFCQSCTMGRQKIAISCDEENDLYRVMKENNIPCIRFDSPEEAILQAKVGGGVMILAQGYPAETVKLDSALYKEVVAKKLRLYIEYPESVPGYPSKGVRETHWERAVVSSDAFGPQLEKNRILMIHGGRYVEMKLDNPDVVVARVAGFDSAVYGIPETGIPVLAKVDLSSGEGGEIYISTTKLSHFVTGRYAPMEAWSEIWSLLLGWLTAENSPRELVWQPTVTPSFTRDESLPADAEVKALQRGVEWYIQSKILLSETGNAIYDKGEFPMGDRIGEMPDSLMSGNGSYGVLEGFRSQIFHDGTQPVLWWRRCDCNGEVAGAMTLAGVSLGKSDYLDVGENIGRWLFSSIMTQGERANPESDAYGLIGWNDVPHYYADLNGYDVYYGDDNARALLGMIMAASALKTDQFNQRIVDGLLANLRLSSKKGFQPDRINHSELVNNGWEVYSQSENVSYSGNFQAYIFASYLWAYKQTDFELFFERAKTGIHTMMAGYPEKWGVTGIQMDRARMLLPLAWLVRVEDTPQHRSWLYQMLEDMDQDPLTGTIPERIEDGKNNFGVGHYKLPKTNEEYGATESPIIQTDGDAGSDLLYAVNFAFLGLHEAAASTGDPLFKEAEDKLAEFLIRIQVKSALHPELDGGWFRGFDFNRWEYWASNGDAGWGAWSIESGWSQSWITMVLSLRSLGTSYWDFTHQHDMKKYFDDTILMFFKDASIVIN